MVRSPGLISSVDLSQSPTPLEVAPFWPKATYSRAESSLAFVGSETAGALHRWPRPQVFWSASRKEHDLHAVWRPAREQGKRW